MLRKVLCGMALLCDYGKERIRRSFGRTDAKKVGFGVLMAKKKWDFCNILQECCDVQAFGKTLIIICRKPINFFCRLVRNSLILRRKKVFILML